MSENTFPTFTDEEIDDMPRADLQKHLKERGEPAGGTNDQLIERLKEWCATQVPPDQEDGATEDDAEDDAAEEDDAADAGNPPVDDQQAPPPPTQDPSSPPEAPTKEPAAEVVTRRGGPRKTSFGKVLTPDEPPAENFVKECETATLVRLHSSPIVQRIAIPFGTGAKARALAIFGIDLKGYVNEELGSKD